ncbi:hypothetical protein ACQRXC_26530 (plasmid) [Niallia taxi]|uniref:hypothetical protein n=1 Tax=Niallia taxi TaxID=2499688 RepID=UPI0015F4A466|nr:hypothetical protein [Niallia taxi]MDK8643753.1 hypothetical protein [Niallia taxi]MED4057787.1 hypothetical protein [Niallia taxi]
MNIVNIVSVIIGSICFFGFPVILGLAIIQFFRGKPAKNLFFVSIGMIPILFISIFIGEFTTPNYWERQKQTKAEERENQKIAENINKNQAEAEKAQEQYNEDMHKQVANSLRSPEEIRSVSNIFDYNTLIKDPDNYIGKYAKFKGVINEIRDSENGGVGSIVALDVGDGNLIRVHSPIPLESQSGDSITVYGTITEFISYTNNSGEELTAPDLIADIVE